MRGSASIGIVTIVELPQIDHLIVDEYQDLNACDQEFSA